MGNLLFGTAVREITPAYPVWMHGYANRDRKSDGVSEPIYLGCLAISNGDRIVLLISCDLIGIQSHVCEQFYDLIEQETGIGYPDVLFSCSHTHFAPALQAGTSSWPQAGVVEPDSRFVRDFKAKLVEAVHESLRNVRSGRLETVRVPVPQVLFNRRTVRGDGSVQTNFLYPDDPDVYTISPTDTELTILRVTDGTGVKAVWVNFGCHPVTGGQVRERDHYRVSADYPHYLRQIVVKAYACPVFFSLGSAGDAVPINRYGDARQRIGSVLGNTVVLTERLYAADDRTDVLADWIALDVKTIIETEPVVARAEYERARAAYASLLDDPDIDRKGDAYQKSGRRLWTTADCAEPIPALSGQPVYHQGPVYQDRPYRVGGFAL
jgi:hypothetical protein